MLYAIVLTVHVIVCLVLVLVVLLQAGRGGGFSDMLGGGQPQTLFGTQTNAFMLKATEVCAVLFIVTSLTLGILSTRESRSLVTNSKALQDIQASLPAAPPPAPEEPAAAVSAAEPVAAVPEPAKANAA